MSLHASLSQLAHELSIPGSNPTSLALESISCMHKLQRRWVHSQQHAPSRQEDNCSEDENAAGDAVDMEEYDDDMPGALPAGFLPVSDRECCERHRTRVSRVQDPERRESTCCIAQCG